jgi:glycosyltransferase involved in cell wall biosynthesis
VLTWAWHRLGWPTVERLSGQTFDVAFSPTPMLLPSRAPLRVVTVHDLDFLAHPERTWGEMRRDYPSLVARHTGAADLVVTISHFTASEAHRLLNIPMERIVIVRPGVPDWITTLPVRVDGPSPAPGEYILFVGTLEARKNVAGLLEAYARLVARVPDAPRLVLAGGPTPESATWLARAAEGPAAGRVDARGYIHPGDRAGLYARAAMLVLPSYMEGFGLPVLEAMALGIPVIVSTEGALPEVAGAAGLHVPPDDAGGLAEAMFRVLYEPGLAAAMRQRGAEQARQFSWEHSAQTLVEAFADRLRRRPQHAHRH